MLFNASPVRLGGNLYHSIIRLTRIFAFRVCTKFHPSRNSTRYLDILDVLFGESALIGMSWKPWHRNGVVFVVFTKDLRRCQCPNVPRVMTSSHGAPWSVHWRQATVWRKPLASRSFSSPLSLCILPDFMKCSLFRKERFMNEAGRERLIFGTF